ncbi:VOC family protein [Gracilibacillus xinjiangensis]|uniref:VOC family protein n=1 Tax=Gracilibacillus xinjiangensis TaxID=1193282 RepID=A0ABV8WQW4_9BACI
MIHKLGQVMLYVNDQDQAVKFWRDIMDFIIVSDQENGSGMRWVEIAPSRESGTTIVLHDKAMVAELEPEMNLGTPSLMFYSDKIELLREKLLEHKFPAGEITNLPSGKVFNFADYENNYFAVMEKFIEK